VNAAEGRPRHVVSVSLGSSRRDHTARTRFLGTEMVLERRGCDGDVDRAEAAIRELDGRVDAIGLGGLDVHLHIGEETYVIRDGERLVRAARTTPVVDGGGLKRHLEPEAVRWLAANGPLDLRGLRVLMVCALDRFGMAEALEAAGCSVTYGDLMFATGTPYPIRSLAELRGIARKLAREVAKLPVHMIYPIGAAQEAEPEERFPEAYREADLIAGDFHLVRRFMPREMAGKAVLTNTTTSADRDFLRARGIRRLITTTPVYGGRSFGTNLMEAALVAALGRPAGERDYAEALAALDYRPTVVDL
jgi:hypothetical protein